MFQNMFEQEGSDPPGSEMSEISGTMISIFNSTLRPGCIGDNATYASCTIVETQTPTVWEAMDTSITFDLNFGAFVQHR